MGQNNPKTPHRMGWDGYGWVQPYSLFQNYDPLYIGKTSKDKYPSHPSNTGFYPSADPSADPSGYPSPSNQHSHTYRSYCYAKSADCA